MSRLFDSKDFVKTLINEINCWATVSDIEMPEDKSDLSTMVHADWNKLNL